VRRNVTSVRFATDKEQGRLNQTGKRPYKPKGKVVFIGKSNQETVLMDGMFFYVLCSMGKDQYLLLEHFWKMLK